MQAEIERLEPQDAQSIAHLAWEAACERVRLEIEPDEALKRLAQLAKTPVGDAINDSFYGYGFRDEQPERIPLRFKPDNKDAWQRLARITDYYEIPRHKQYPISVRQWVVLATLIVLGVVMAGRGLWQFQNPPETVSELRRELPTRLCARSIRCPGRTDGRPVDRLCQGRPSNPNIIRWEPKLPFNPDRRYRLVVYEVGHQDVVSFTIAANSRLNVQLGYTDTVYACEERQPAVGLTVYRCPEPEGDALANDAVTLSFWRDTDGVTPAGKHVASVGIEFGQCESDNSTAHRLRKVLLATQAVDVVFCIKVDPIRPERAQAALDDIEQFLGPLADSKYTQVILWTVGEPPDLPASSIFWPAQTIRCAQRSSTCVRTSNVWLRMGQSGCLWRRSSQHWRTSLPDPLAGVTPPVTATAPPTSATSAETTPVVQADTPIPPTPTALTIPRGCYEAVINGGFEQIGNTWVLTSGVRPPQYDATQVYEGASAMRMGIVDLPNAFSTVRSTRILPCLRARPRSGSASGTIPNSIRRPAPAHSSTPTSPIGPMAN